MKLSSFRPLFLAAALLATAGLLPAPPAAATVNNVGEITGGTLTIGTYPAHFDVDLSGATGPCPTTAPTVALDLTTTTGGWTTLSTAFDTTAPLSFTYAGATWFLEITKRPNTGTFANTGTIGSASPNNWNQFASLLLSIYPETTPGSCTPAGSPSCSPTMPIGAGATLYGIVGSGAITGEDFDPGATLNANMTTTVTTTSCPYPFIRGTLPATVFLMEVTFP